MRLLMIAPEQFPVPGGGSVEICMLEIAKKLSRKHQVTLISRNKTHSKKISRLGKNLTIVRVPSGSSTRYISSVLRFMKKRHFDLIQVDNRPYYMARIKAAFPHTPISLFLHSLTIIPRTKSVAACLRKADLIIANSSSLKQCLSKSFPDTRQKIRCVHLGVNLSRFEPASMTERMNTKQVYRLGRSFVILFVGRVIPRKGVPLLIKAAKKVGEKISNTKLIIAGKGRKSYIAKLRLQANKLRVPMMFLGSIPHTKIHQIYRLADCFVCPSQKHEAFGLVNVEAMASGVPVIASNIGGIKEIVAHGDNGYLVNNYTNDSSFAYYITKWLKTVD
ncbi:Glycosyltransferase involved in cell wall bisynthesis [Paenibacillus sp. UNCCL117]|uniref:glycosyltransferase family 4 protein n=1 Tax=unclassified Paenibacillus TaxID=185978 RepID=UPI000880F8CF|nr:MULTISPECIES: glycosyltransferase family 4 protein [unclassified Paenibacillus]SDC95851.1 Glycosyltransferase involved in cell wall bisynthesis [Paenibacillus sp. cl123]SFW30163.1 Glycosyltransferase involved in cell wall bisynthesis [Paenibacillus sp. UNCCL117]